MTNTPLAKAFQLNVNGHVHRVHVAPDTPLIYVLRNDLGLKSPKFACGLEQCGACKVIIDGEAMPSCRMPVRSVQGKHITTLEGLGTRHHLHPLQQAFIDEQAIQCGFCVPGMIITAKALLDRNPKPTDREIKHALSGNLCRCGVYDRIRRAVKRAAGISDTPSSWKNESYSKTHSPKESAKPTDGMAGTLAFRPDIDAWVRINPNNTIRVFTGKVELGQHIKTALAMIAAEELEVKLDQILLISGDTAQTPNEGYTAGSMSMEFSGNAIRNACAEAKQILLEKAAEVLSTNLENLVIKEGVITDTVTTHTTTYGALFGGKRFDGNVMGKGFLKSTDDYEIVGTPSYRDDLVAKVLGEPCFIQDLDFPQMVHGRVVRPPNYGAGLVSVDIDTAIKLPGVINVVQNGSFLAVIAEREEQAVNAMAFLKTSAQWETGVPLPDQENLMEDMKHQPHAAYLIKNGRTVEDPPPDINVPDNAAQTLSATYFRPYHMHAAIGPSAGVAHFVEGKLTVWSHNQGPFPLRAAIAQVLEMDPHDIRVIHMDGPGCYGHNGADDAAMDAALLAREVPGRPVSLKYMREDEHAWEPYGPAMVIDLQSSLDAKGKVLDWHFDVWSCDHSGRPRPDREGGSGMLSAWYLEKPFKPLSKQQGKTPQLGSSRNAEPLYDFPNQRTVNHYLTQSPLRVSSHRGLGAYANIFAIESFVDELAHAANSDPVEFRLKYLKDDRAREVIIAAAEKSNWMSWKENKQPDQGLGIGFSKYKNSASYVAVVVALHVNRPSGRILLDNAYIACDAGQIVNPDGIANQLEGAFLQSASWTLKEQVQFDRHGITSVDWHSYPILRFADAPIVDITLMDKPGQPYMGVGEGAMGPIPAAIANAVYNAVGIRLRHVPFTPDKVAYALLNP